MKTKLHSRLAFLGNVLNLKNSFILLFVLFFTMSSFGQTEDPKITFTCGVNTISFTGTPDVPMIGDYPSWSNGTLAGDEMSGPYWILKVQE